MREQRLNQFVSDEWPDPQPLTVKMGFVRRQDADMGRHCDLRLDCHHEEAVESETFALRNSPCTGSEHV